MVELGLFPLPLVLFPTERIPLHIFEPRYRELIDECVRTGAEFGLALATGDGAVHEVGTRTKVVEVLELLDDGNMNIVVEGGARFRLLELTSGRAYTTGLVEEVLDDEDDPASPTDAERARSLFEELVALAESAVDVPEPDSARLDWQIAARVDLGIDAEQELLALQSPRARMSRLAELLAIALESMHVEKALHERAGRNGKVTPLDAET